MNKQLLQGAIIGTLLNYIIIIIIISSIGIFILHEKQININNNFCEKNGYTS